MTKTTEKEIPRKLGRFNEFFDLLKDLALQGTDKFTGAEIDAKETIDIIPDILGKEGYVTGVMFDCIKRVIRFKNQRRERDLLKMALWCYLLWMYLFPTRAEADMELPRILPHRECPAELNGGSGKFWVECCDPTCEAHGPRMDIPKEAIEEWNRLMSQ